MGTIFGGWTEVDEEIEEIDTCRSGDGVTTGIIEEVADVLRKLDVLRRCCVSRDVLPFLVVECLLRVCDSDR